MGVECIDLWQIHRPDLLTHPAEVARALFEREGQQIFWAFFDRMLLTTRKITTDVLLSAAADVGADMHGFRRALRTRVHKNSLYSCREEAEALGIDISPTLVINDVMLVGEPSDQQELSWLGTSRS